MSEGSLRIALVLASATVGGTEQQAALLARELARAGDHVDVFLVDARGVVQDFAPATLWNGDGSGPKASVRRTWRLRHRLRTGRYDIVHAVLARAHVLSPWLVRHGTPVVAWRRNLGIHLQGRPVQARLEDLASKRWDVVISNSEPVRDYWERRGQRGRLGLDRIIRNGIAATRFEPVDPADLAGELPLLVSVGNLRPVKAHPVAIDVAAALGRRGMPVRLAIIGEGRDRAALTAYANERDVDLLLPGHLADTRPWLAAADCCLHTATTEGSSNAVAEALAAGRPVVSTDVGDAAQLLPSQWLATVGDVDGLAAAVTGILIDPASARAEAHVRRSLLITQRGVGAFVAEHRALYTHLKERS